MNNSEKLAFLQPYVAAEMRGIEPTGVLGNETLLADAAATVGAYILMKSYKDAIKNPIEAAASFNPEEMRQIIDAVDYLIRQKSGEHKDLKYGHVIKGAYGYGVMIGSRRFTSVWGVPGLHNNDRENCLPERPAKKLFLSRFFHHYKTLPEMDIPRITEKDIRIDESLKYKDNIYLPVRSGPGIFYIEEFGTKILENMLENEIDEFALSIVNTIHTKWNQREAMDKAYWDMHSKIFPILDKYNSSDLEMEFQGVNYEEKYVGTQWATTLVKPVFEVLGNDLTRQKWLLYPSNSTVEKSLMSQIQIQRKRKKILEASKQTGMRGRIDLVTLAAVKAYSKDTESVLREISVKKNLVIETGLRKPKKDPIRLTWRNGTVVSSFDLNDKISWQHGQLNVKNMDLPESVVSQIAGRNIKALIEHPLIDPDTKIKSASKHPRIELMRFNLDVPWASFCPETGHIEPN